MIRERPLMAESGHSLTVNTRVRPKAANGNQLLAAPKFAEFEAWRTHSDLRSYGRGGALSLDLLWTYAGSSAEFQSLRLELSG